MIKVGIVGFGVVGKATAKMLGKIELEILDPEIGHTGDMKECDIIFICINEKLSTMKNLKLLINTLVLQNKKCLFVIRTTVTPGITRAMAIRHKREFVFMPEFLREWNAKEDAVNPDKIVIGTEDLGIFELLRRLIKVKIPPEKIIQVKPIEAEIAKLALNSLALIKVVFAEELEDLTKAYHADYGNVYEIFKMDQNINERHLKVGNLKGYRGANGKCLPKDTEFLIKAGKKKTRMSLLEIAEILNNLYLKGEEVC